jgi:hypothetical protein
MGAKAEHGANLFKRPSLMKTSFKPRSQGRAAELRAAHQMPMQFSRL